MIRRETTAQQEEQRWILISQVEHARLSGMMADAWNDEAFARSEWRPEMVAAITHHDDGWAAWEVAPKVDGESGRPLDFTETALTDSLAIWRESIQAAADIGPLAAYMVSGHFSRLLERFSSRWKSDATLTALVNNFFSEQQAERDKWLAMWQKTVGQPGTHAAAETAVSWLQLFDALSLWLCCADRHDPQAFSLPTGASVDFQPRGPCSLSVSPCSLSASPWPFKDPAVMLEAVGRAVPAQPYENPSDLVTAAAEPVRLKWSLASA